MTPYDKTTETIPASNQMLADLFSTCARSSERALIVRSGGNWGDHLIYLGGEHIASESGLVADVVTFDQFMQIDCRRYPLIYIHGGGGFNPWCSGKVARALDHAVRSASGIVIQGPQTFANNSDDYQRYLPSFRAGSKCKRVRIYARELTTFEYLKTRLPENVELHLDEDTAFAVPRDFLQTIVGAIRRRISLVCRREDNESAMRDDELWHNCLSLDPAKYARSFEHWVRIHAVARSLVTNRTHSAILGSLLGIPTTIMPGSYHKNRSIWEFSLKKRGVAWGDVHSDGQGVSRFVTHVTPILRRSERIYRMFWWTLGVPLK